MRLRSASPVWLAAIVVSFAAVTGVPGLRDVVMEALYPEPGPVDYLAEARGGDDDGNAWLAALARNPLVRVSEDDLDEAYAQAERVFAASAAPHLLYADSLMAEMLAPDPDRCEKAERALARAAAMEPDNAAPEYLLAHLALLQGEEEAAAGHLRRALGAKSWTLHQAEAAKAAYQVAREKLPPLAAFTVASEYVPASLMRLTALAQRLSEMADRAEQQGDTARAMVLRRSVLHLAELMLSSGYDVIEGFTGCIIWRRVTEAEMSPAETKAVEARVKEGQDEMEAFREAGRVKRLEQLRQRGQGALAAEIESFAGLADQAFARLYSRQALDAESHYRKFVLEFQVAESVHAAMGSLAAVLLFGVLAALVKASGRAVEPIRWRWWGWAAAAIGCGGAVVAVSKLLLLRLAGEHYIPGLWAALPWGRVFAVVGLPLVALVALVGVIVHRRRGQEAPKAGPAGSYVGTMTALLLPAAALLCLVSLGVSVVGASHAVRQGKTNQAILESGEMGYYGLRAR